MSTNQKGATTYELLTTDKISKEYARSKRDSDGNTVISSFLQNLIIQRSRIAKKAKAKEIKAKSAKVVVFCVMGFLCPALRKKPS